jgi:PhzF family phenazine biosynthesis protein
MNRSPKIWIVDAFTDKAYKGNPAAVMLVSDFPTDAQSIAAEMNLSETAFVKPLRDNHFHIRWLTPTAEVKLCGHATLASAHILFQQDLVPQDHIVFESLSGPLFVKQEKNGLVLDFPLQKTGAQLDPVPFSAALNLSQTDIIEVLQAVDDVIVVLHDEDSVKHLNPDLNMLKTINSRGVIVTAAGKTFDCVSRFFAPTIGIPEDPVTGSAHCKLADYWSRKLEKTALHAYQASARGGSMHIEIQGERVLLKGQAVTIMEGIWKVQ